MEALILMTLLVFKHFIVDFPLQKPYQWMNKGTYGHPGGIIHAGLHGLGTAACFWWWAPFSCIILGVIDAVVHYHIDWAKMKINKDCGWKPDQHEQFWWLLGVDQLCHYLTYIGLVSLVVN